MKHVFSTIGELCHTWAHNWQAVEHGRTGSNSVFFVGDTIYSYGHHFPIARFTENADGQTIVLFNSDTYSVSTSRHQREVSSAVSHYTVFEVSDVMAKTPREHMSNWTELRSNLNAARNSLNASRDPTAHDLAVCDRLAARCNDYAAAFNVQGLEPHQFPIQAFSEADRAEWRLKIDIKAHEREIRQIEAEAKRERENAARIKAEAIRDAKQSRLEFFERLTFGLYKAPRPTWKYGYQSTGAYARGDQSRDKKAEILEKIKAWKRGNGSMPYGYDGPVLMRIEADRKNIRTSKNAVFPVADCVAIWPAIEAAQANKARDNTTGRKLGMYGVDYIAENGDIKAGCHFVTFAECRKLAIALELVKPTLAEALAYKARKVFA